MDDAPTRATTPSAPGEPLKVLVCGSRGWRDTHRIAKRMAELPRDTFVINGGASGADYLAKQEAMRQGFGVMTVYPDWNKHGKRAGVVRNNFMLDQEPDLVIAFWDCKSRGTKHTMEEAVRRGIPVEVITEIEGVVVTPEITRSVRRDAS